MNGIGPISPRRGSHAMTALAIAAMVAALFGAENASASDAGPIDPAAIDAFVEHQLARQLVPGAAIAITRGDRVVHGRGYGEAAEGVPATVGTRFAIASLSKGITAVAVMQLVERGAVDLDAPVIRYLPDFTVADARTARITVRHLLNHTSGLADAGFPHMTLPQPRSIAERVASLRSARLVAEPGTQFHYFDPNYAILARLVEVVGGEPFGAYLARNVFEPLGMESTVSLVHSAELESAPGLAQGHIGLFGVAVPRDEAQGYLAGSTGVISTAADMARYLAFQAGAHPAGDSVLSGAALRELQSPPGRPDSTYAMGWIRDDHPQLGPILHHNGVLGTFHADAVLVPDQQIGIVLLVNSSHALAAYDVTWRGVLALIGGRSPIDGPIDAREIELAFAALTVLTVGLRLRNLVRARGRTRGPLASLGGALRLARAVVPGVAFLALPQVVSATSGRVFSLGQIAAAMPGASVFLLANAVIGLAGVAISLSARRRATGALPCRRW